MNVSLARSKSASDLQRFRDLMAVAQKLERKDLASEARPYLEAAQSMVRRRIIYFVH